MLLRSPRRPITLHLPHVVFVRRHLGRVARLDDTPVAHVICRGHVLRP
jgi:hypothetical protein